MRVYLGSDHAGFELKAHLVQHLASIGYDVVDKGAYEYDPEDDYPSYCIETAQAVLDDEGSLGLVIGGSGNGEQIAANKVKGIRAALIHSDETARLCREHNDAQVAGIGARTHTVEEATALVETYLSTPFSEDPRHKRRIAEMIDYENLR